MNLKVCAIVFLALTTCLSFAQKWPSAPKAPVAKDMKLVHLTKEQLLFKANYLRNKRSDKVKAQYIKATMALADYYMDRNTSLAPRVKYPNALKFYREVLKVDPKNKEAKVSSDTIVQIYKSMGRPVPGGG